VSAAQPRTQSTSTPITTVTTEFAVPSTLVADGSWAASIMQSHLELSELSAIELDGIIVLTAEHEETGYRIERGYVSWQLAKQDLLDWIARLSCANTTASAPGLQRGRIGQTVLYDETKRRPTAIGRSGEPGRPQWWTWKLSWSTNSIRLRMTSPADFGSCETLQRMQHNFRFGLRTSVQ
jgi:hypothetical protein